MPIYKGSTELTDLKLGSTQVKKVYQGSNFVWSNAVWDDSVFGGSATIRSSSWASDAARTLSGVIMCIDANGVAYKSLDNGATFTALGTLNDNSTKVSLNGQGIAAYQNTPTQSAPTAWVTAHNNVMGNYSADTGATWSSISQSWKTMGVVSTDYKYMRLVDFANGNYGVYASTSTSSLGTNLTVIYGSNTSVIIRSGDYKGAWVFGPSVAERIESAGTVHAKTSPALGSAIRAAACAYNSNNLSVAVGGSVSDIRASTDGGTTWFSNNPPTTQAVSTVDSMGWGNGVYRICLAQNREIWENDLSSASSPWTLLSNGGSRVRSIIGTLDRFLVQGSGGRCQYQLYSEM